MAATVMGALRRHRWRAGLAFAAVLGSALVTGVLTPPEYRSELKLIFQGTESKTPVVEGFAEAAPYTRQSDPLENKLELLKTSTILSTAITQHNLRDPQTGAPLTEGALRAGLEARSILGTDIVMLAFRSADAQLAKRAVEAVAETLIDDISTSARARARTLRQFIERKLPTVERELKRSEARLQEFQRRSGSVEIVTEAQNAVRELSELEGQERTLAQTEVSTRSQIASLRRQLGGLSSGQAVVAVRVSEDPNVLALRQQLAEVEGEIAKQSARLGPKHPQMVALNDQRTELRKLIDQQIASLGGRNDNSTRGRVDPVSQNLTRQLAESEVRLSGIERELGTVRTAIRRYQDRLKGLPERQVTYAQLQRAVQVNTTAYNLLANRLEEAKIAEGQSFSNVRIVEPAVLPTRPAWPNFLVLGAGGTIAGLVAAGAVVAVGESLRRRELDHQEVQQLLQVPVLASLPLIDAGASDMLRTWNREAYRMLCMNLRFLSDLPGAQATAMVIASAIANEGKSTVATRLASSLAQAGQRTLIIDADLVRPSLTDVFDLHQTVGLSEWLYSVATARTNNKPMPVVRDYVRETNTPRLHVLGAGELRLADSASLLDPEAVDLLLDQLEPYYDQIIIDTPPLGGYAHGYALAARARGILLVLRPGRSDEEVLLRVKQTIERNRIPLLGTIINGVAAEEEFAYGYYDRRPKGRLLVE